MKKNALYLAVALICSVSAGRAAEVDRRSPLDAFRGDSQYHMMLCSMSVKLATMTGDTSSKDADYPSCISKGLGEVKQRYSKAVSFAKSGAKKEALKTYYAAWVSAMHGIAPKSDERTISYERRTAAAEDRLNELWTRVEIE